MRKLTKTIANLEGLKSESSIGNVREILSLAAKVLGAEHAITGEYDYGNYLAEFEKVLQGATAKSRKLLAKNPDLTFDELVRKVCNR